MGQQIPAQAGEVVEVEGAPPALRFPVPLSGVLGEGCQIAGELAASHAGIGVEDRRERFARGQDELLLRPLGPQRQGGGAPDLAPCLRELTRSVRVQRRSRRRRRFFSRRLERAAELRHGAVELAPRARVLVERRLRIAEQRRHGGPRLGELLQQPRQLIGEPHPEFSPRAQTHFRAEPPCRIAHRAAERAFQRPQRGRLTALAQEAAGFDLRQDGEPWIDPGRRGMAPENLPAERVDGPDLREPEIAADAHPGRVARGQLVHARPDASLELRGGLLREGDRPQLRGRQRVCAPEKVDADGHQPMRLAGSRSGLDHGAGAFGQELRHGAPRRRSPRDP